MASPVSASRPPSASSCHAESVVLLSSSLLIATHTNASSTISSILMTHLLPLFSLPSFLLIYPLRLTSRRKVLGRTVTHVLLSVLHKLYEARQKTITVMYMKNPCRLCQPAGSPFLRYTNSLWKRKLTKNKNTSTGILTATSTPPKSPCRALTRKALHNI